MAEEKKPSYFQNKKYLDFAHCKRHYMEKSNDSFYFIIGIEVFVIFKLWEGKGLLFIRKFY